MSVVSSQKEIIVVHSGGMDSSICLALAIREVGAKNVLALHFDYNQRHRTEIEAATKICDTWGVEQQIIKLDFLQDITCNALVDHELDIIYQRGETINTLVVGRNGLMMRLAAIRAHSLGAHCVSTGVIEVESANSGYRDCSRDYMNKIQEILRIDLDDPQFEIRTPVVFMTKAETMRVAKDLGILDFLLEETVSCYNGIKHEGCGTCPACLLRNDGMKFNRMRD